MAVDAQPTACPPDGLDAREAPGGAADESLDADQAEAAALALLQRMGEQLPEFQPRPGQQHMVRHIARALHGVQLGVPAAPAALAVVQAGTGVGKSAAYLAAVVSQALRQQRRVVIATATVALQEQLLHQDLPALAQVLGQPLPFALAKGRGRYVCAIKLAQWADQPTATPLWADDAVAAAALGGQTTLASWYRDWLDGTWDGDRDALASPPESALWSVVAADRNTCTARHCPRFGQCSFYRARMALTHAQVIVANHDWVLASLGQNTLPALDACFWVFDEAHHLPRVGLSQFAAHTDVTATAWLDRLQRTMADAAQAMQSSLTDTPSAAQPLRQAMQDLARVVVADWPGALPAGDWRQPAGGVPEAWVPTLSDIQRWGGAWLDQLNALGEALKQRLRDDPIQAELWAAHYARLGAFAPRLVALVHTTTQWLAQPEPPLAKWASAVARGGQLALTLHASPIEAASGLRDRLWSGVRAAVLTSATLSEGDNWAHFLAESGLDEVDGVQACKVESPFDHACQARLIVVETQADPAAAQAFQAELADLLLADLAAVQRGALVLFTSRAQMDVVTLALRTRPEHAALCADVQVQGEGARPRLLERHRDRVQAGRRAILFGMQSFGEGLDLPGALCEDLFIAKLPFASPTHPVEQARAEWLRAHGGDPFSDWVVPETARRLMQWTGRALRRVSDRAQLVCYDRRLVRTGYGRRLLASLPAYTVWQRRGRGPELLPIK